MSYSIHIKAAGDLIGARLTDAVNAALATATEAERPHLQAAADTAVEVIGETANEDHSIEIAIAGAVVESSGPSLSFNVTSSRLRPDASKRNAPSAQWQPRRGPLAASRADRDRASTSSPAPNPATPQGGGG